MLARRRMVAIRERKGRLAYEVLRVGPVTATVTVPVAAVTLLGLLVETLGPLVGAMFSILEGGLVSLG